MDAQHPAAPLSGPGTAPHILTHAENEDGMLGMVTAMVV
jgi:hypothetical protein